MKKPLIYLKSPKTAGTSMSELLSRISNSKKITKGCHCKWCRSLFEWNYLVPHRPFHFWWDTQVHHLTEQESEKYDIFILTNPSVIKLFKSKFPTLYKEANKLIIFRDPKDRVFSSYHYLKLQHSAVQRLIENKKLIDVLKDPPRYKSSWPNPSGEWFLKRVRRPARSKRDRKLAAVSAAFTHFTQQQLSSIDCDISILDDSSFHVINFHNIVDDIKKIFKKLDLNDAPQGEGIKHLRKTVYEKVNLSADEVLHIEKLFKRDVEFWNKFIEKSSNPQAQGF